MSHYDSKVVLDFMTKLSSWVTIVFMHSLSCHKLIINVVKATVAHSLGMSHINKIFSVFAP